MCALLSPGARAQDTYRVIENHENPDTAYNAVSRIWVPNRAWKAFIHAELKAHGIAFDPL